jgi:vesicle coat complex subunit
MAIAHAQAMEDAQRVLALVQTMETRIVEAYNLLKATGVHIREESIKTAFWSLDDLATEAHRVIMAVIDEQYPKDSKAH